MNRLLLRTELSLLSRDRALGVLLLVMAAACAYGIYNGAARVRLQAETIAAVEQGARVRMDQALAQHQLGQRSAAQISDRAVAILKARPLGDALDNTQYALLPPAPLGALATGQTDLSGFYAGISARELKTEPTEEIDNPLHLMSGRFDLTFVILLLYPLLIMGLLFNLVAGEREQGTLRLIAAQPARMTRVIGMKVAVRCAVMLALPALIALGAMILTDAGVTRVLLWLVTVLCYGAFWIAVALCVNAYGRTSEGNAAVLLAVWLLVIVAVPATQHMLVSVRHPPPSQITLVAAMRSAQDDAKRKGDQLVRELYFEHPELAPIGEGEDAQQYWARLFARRQAIDLHVQRRVQPVLDAFERAALGQQEWARRYRFLSPALMAQAALEDVAGSGMDRQRSFREQVRVFHEEWRQFSRSHQAQEIPRFVFKEEPLSAIAARVAAGLVAMLVLAGVLTVMASRRLSRTSRLL